MANSEKQGKSFTFQQRKGAIGLGLMTLATFAIAAELPIPWAMWLGVGEIVSLLLVAVSAGICFYTPHIYCEYKRGTGVLCEKCKMPALLGTYHCEVCEVCVPAYSHHSEWLNSCIGACNYSAYLLCLFSIGTVAICQILASTVLLTLIATDLDTARRIVYRYSLLDQGYLYRVFLFFHLLISATLTITTWASFAVHSFRTLSLWNKQRKSRRQIQPKQVINRFNPSSDTGLPLPSIALLKIQNESFDSHEIEISDIADQTSDGKCGPSYIPYQQEKANN